MKVSYDVTEIPAHAIKTRMVAHVPIGKGLLTEEGYLIYCTGNEKYLTYRSFLPVKLGWEDDPTSLFLSEDFDASPMQLVMLINDMQIFIGEEAYPSCIVVPTVYHCRQLNERENIVEVYLIKDFKQSFPWSDIAPWQR